MGYTKQEKKKINFLITIAVTLNIIFFLVHNVYAAGCCRYYGWSGTTPVATCDENVSDLKSCESHCGPGQYATGCAFFDGKACIDISGCPQAATLTSSDRGCCRCIVTTMGGTSSYSCSGNETDSECSAKNSISRGGSTQCQFFLGKNCREVEHCTPTPPPPEEKKPEYKYEPVYPTLQIPIPGVPGLTNFAKVEIKGPEGERYVYIPWISQYIAAIYGWAMGIVGILATVMILWGGIIYLTAGGIPERISTAKDYITSAIAGLLLAFGSYLLLYTINPSLVKFGAMKIKVVERKSYEALLAETTEDTSPEETTCSAGGKEAAKQAAYNKFQTEIPGWPDEWIKDLVPGDRIIVFNANPGPAGLHAAVFLGWQSEGVAKVIWGSYKSEVKQGTYCIGSKCSPKTPVARIFKLNDEPEPQVAKNLPTGCPIQLQNPLTVGQGPNNPRAQEFKEKIRPYLTGGLVRGRVLQAAQYAVNCKVNLGSCGKTADIFGDLAGAGGRGTRIHAIDANQSNYLESIKCPKK
jgi:hypothetical protein